MTRPTFAELLAHPGVTEECELRGRLGFMAYHGGGLEETTDIVARQAAERSGASYYGVLHPPDWDLHIPSIRVTADQSPLMASFIEHVDVVITIHGFGRRPLFTSLLLGGQNRTLAAHVARPPAGRAAGLRHRRRTRRHPARAAGVHDRNPVNLPTHAGVQIELPPRVRGSSPLWWDWESGLVPHTEALITGLAAAATTFEIP